jgi:hypothetical protein
MNKISFLFTFICLMGTAPFATAATVVRCYEKTGNPVAEITLAGNQASKMKLASGLSG